MDDEEFEFLKINEAAALLAIPAATLRWWRSKGKGPRSLKFGRHVKYGARTTQVDRRAMARRHYRAVRQCPTPNACTSSGRSRTRSTSRAGRGDTGCAGHRAGLDAGGARRRTPCRAQPVSGLPGRRLRVRRLVPVGRTGVGRHRLPRFGRPSARPQFVAGVRARDLATDNAEVIDGEED